MKLSFYPILFWLLLSGFHLTAQEANPGIRIFFPSGQYKVGERHTQRAKNLFDSLRALHKVTIDIQGYTDNVGSYQSNQVLSKKRADATQEGLIRAGIPADAIETVEGFGPDAPEGDNHTAAGRAANRRVKVVFKWTEVKEAPPEDTDNIFDLYRQVETPLQKFCINPYRDTTLRCAKGTIIVIKANSLTSPAACGNNCISFSVREDFLKSEMLLDNLSTTSDGAIIETQGMVYTEARDCQGNKMTLQKDIVILQPTDSIRPGAKIFDGNRGHDSIMNWTVSNNSVLAGFTLNELDYCGSWICSTRRGPDCISCPFFFCRIGRIGKATGALFSKKQRGKNRQFRACLIALDSMENSQTLRTAIKDSGTARPKDSLITSSCSSLAALFDRYGVKDVEGLIKAINKPLMDSFRVSTIEQLKDTLAKIKTRNIEMNYLNKKISFDDFKYYVYNRSKLGWSNVDQFADLSGLEKVALNVNVPVSANTDCKLVFRNRRVVVSASQAKKTFEFWVLPKGEAATVVAVKYKKGQAYLAIKEIVTSSITIDMEFRALTLDELRSELKKLDE